MVDSNARGEMRVLRRFVDRDGTVCQREDERTGFAECHSSGRIGERVGDGRVLAGSASRYVVIEM